MSKPSVRKPRFSAYLNNFSWVGLQFTRKRGWDIAILLTSYGIWQQIPRIYSGNSCACFRQKILSALDLRVKGSLERGRVKKPSVDWSRSGFYQRFDHSYPLTITKRYCLSHCLGTHTLVQTVTPPERKIMRIGLKSEFSYARFIHLALNINFSFVWAAHVFCNLLYLFKDGKAKTQKYG